MDAGEEGSPDGRTEDGDVNDHLVSAAYHRCEKRRDQRAEERADSLKAFDRQIGHAAFFGIQRADCHNQKRKRKGKAVCKDFIHLVFASLLSRFAGAVREGTCEAISADCCMVLAARYFI